MKLNLTNSVDRQPGPMGMSGKQTAAARYNQLVSNRSAYLQRARDCSKVTIPGLVAEQVYGDNGDLKTPYQSFGSRGINFLSNKLLITLFPPNRPFFKLEIDDLALRVQEAGPGIKTELDAALVQVEHAVMGVLDSANGRASLHEAFKHLLVSGNVLLYVSDAGIRVIHLDRFVVCRDPMGHVTEILVEEEVYPQALPQGFLEDDEKTGEYDEEPSKRTIKLHTCVKFYDGECHWYQEAKGKEIPNTHGMCKADCSPWIVLRHDRVETEEYGRSYVEQYYGDLLALENLSQAILESSAAAAKAIFLVNPNGMTRPRTLASAANGAIVQGSASDVTVVQTAKGADMQIANATVERIEARLAYAFMLNTAVQRPGERVTASEIEFMSQEVNAGTSGLYSILTQELQLPLVRRLMHILQRQRKLPAFPKGRSGQPLVNPKPVTGLEAIGRGDDKNKLVEFITTAQQVLGPEIMSEYINVDEALRRLAASGSVDTTNLVKTREQLENERAAAADAQAQQQQQQQMLELMKSGAASQVAKNYTQEGAPYGPQFEEGVDGDGNRTPTGIPDLGGLSAGNN